MSITLETMNRKDLEQMRADVDKAIIDLHKREKSDALAAAKKAAAEFGFSLDELTTSRSGKAAKGTSAEPKYLNPENPAQTWTGKGRQPNWFKAALSSGKNADDLLI